MVKVAKMLKRHLPNLLSYFLYRITNATSEGFNSVIQALKYASRGFRSFKNHRTRILFFCCRLESYCQELCLRDLNQAAFCRTPSVNTFR